MSAEELPVTPAQLGDQRPGQESVTDAGPQGLTLVSVSRDGRRMLFVDAAGHEFTVDVDDRLRAALPADSPRRSEPPVTNPPSSTLRPRDIQARIRSGESAEQVATAAGTTVEKIMAFAAPVLAEREHMAERAQKASVRRRAGDPAGTARTLGEAVAGHLRSLDLDPEQVSWDSYRRGDGRWKLTAEFDTAPRSGIAELTFDAAGNYVSLDNDDARWLVGDKLPEPEPAPVAPVLDDLHAVRQRRAQMPSIAPVAETPAPPTTPPPSAPPTAPQAPAADVSPTEDTIETPLEIDTPVEAYLFDDPVESDKGAQKRSAPQASEEPEAEAPADPAPERPARRTSRRKRASVPSWDEIMFGGGKSE